MTDDYGSNDLARDHRAQARAAREALAERLGDDMPGRPERAATPPSGGSDFDPCAGWFAAANLAYSLASGASDINTAIEWTITGDNYSLVGEACQETTTTLSGSA